MQVASFHVHNKTTVAEFKKTLAEKWDVAVRAQRLWPWERRQNLSVRLAEPVDPGHDGQRISEVAVGFHGCLHGKTC